MGGKRGHRSDGRLLVIGGAEDRAGDSALLRVFANLAAGAHGAPGAHGDDRAAARIVLVTTASGVPASSLASYSAAFRSLGVPDIRELHVASKHEADDDQTITELHKATGVFFTGGDQARLEVLVGSRTNQLLHDQLAVGAVVIAGTSAGATALGETMILGGTGGTGGSGGRPPGPARDRDGAVIAGLRTAPGLGLLPGVIVDMHFAERQRLPRLVAAVLRQPSLVGLGIDEDTAVLTGPGRFEVLGRGTVTTVEARPVTTAEARAATASGQARMATGPGGKSCFDVHLHRIYAGDAFRLHQP
jgi:cyanophycinase